MFTAELADELRRATEVRAEHLSAVIERIRGDVPASRRELRAALDLFAQLAPSILDFAEVEWDRVDDARARVRATRPLLRHLVFAAEFVAKHLSHGTRRELSETLVEEVRRELADLDAGEYRVVMAHGRSDNFETVFGDVAGKVLRAVTADPVEPGHFSFFNVPRFEGSAVHWRPVLLGHEVAHVAINKRGCLDTFDLRAKFDIATAERLDNPFGRGLHGAMRLYQVAENWGEELLCDAHATRRFGPAAVASIAEYLMSLESDASPTDTHPHGLLRIWLLLDQLGQVHTNRLRTVVAPWAGIDRAHALQVEPWAQYLSRLFIDHAEELRRCLDDLGATEYDEANVSTSAIETADALLLGTPGDGHAVTEDGVQLVTDTAIVNGAWIARTEGAVTPVRELGRKALENLDFLRHWREAGGNEPAELYERADLQEADGEVGAPLSRDQLRARLRADDDRRLTVIPLLQEPEGVGLDLRLGNRFISFRRSGIAAFDPLDVQSDPRAMQMVSELAWTGQFVLHPNEMVLGSTLEYLVIPPDLSAQVISRSSYGRLGLLTATAVQIHPGFRGCLTLELVNLSNVPLRLTPGERIAQLVVSRTTPTADVPVKYNCPTGPQFSKVRADEEAAVIRRIRHRDR